MKVGIAGVGFMGSTHLASWAETDAEIIGCVAETVEEAQPIAKKYHCKVFASLERMITEVDIIDICTPTHLHYENALAAARAGKHIICEKPLARTTKKAREIILAARQNDVCLFVGHVVRYFPENYQAYQMVANGKVGNPGVIHLSRESYRPKKPVGNWFLDEAKSGGILMDLMIHDFDYARWIAGDVENVYAKKVSIAHPNAPVDYGLVILKHRNGALSHIAGAWAYPPPEFRTSFEIAGDRGLIDFSSVGSIPVENLLLNTDSEEAPDVALADVSMTESPYTAEIRDFYQAIVEDRPARVSPEDALAAVQIAEAALQSSQTGQMVPLQSLAEVLS